MTRTVGYVGLDHSHRRPYLESLRQLPVDITCACEPDEGFDPERVSELDLDGVSFYRDPEDLFAEEDVDVAWVTLSNRETPSVVETAVEHGVDVFAEKSLARTAADLEPIAETTRRSGATVVAAYVNRAHPVYRELRTLRAEGFFGDLRGFDASFVKNTLSSRLRAEDQPDYLYRRRDARGGILQWLGCHLIDLAEWILDDPIDRVCAQTSYGTDGADTEDGALVQVETESNAMGCLQLGYYLGESPGPRGDSPLGPEYEPMHVYGMDGAAVVGRDQRTLRMSSDSARWESAPTRTLSFDLPGTPGYGGQAGLDYVDAFFDLCEGNESDLVATIEDELRVLRVLDAAYESAAEDRWVEVP